MNYTDYKKYSLSQLEEWMYDALSAAEATPQEIYDVIKGVVKERYYYHKHHVSIAYELLALINGNSEENISSHQKPLVYDRDDKSPECKSAWNDFWEKDKIRYDLIPKEDKVVKWQLPVEMDPSGECYVMFPDDLLEKVGLKEGDKVEWNNNGDGSYTLHKITSPLGMDEC